MTRFLDRGSDWTLASGLRIAVNIGGTGGLVEGITLRTIVLCDLGGSVHIIPHASVDRVTNLTKD